jgi:AbrB family looped-hinge helix DNA binding protein
LPEVAATEKSMKGSSSPKTHVTLDRNGRITIPRRLRDELRLMPGDELEVETQGGEIVLRPVRGTSALTQEHGVWVFYGGGPLPAFSTEELHEKIRRERDAANFGGD